MDTINLLKDRDWVIEEFISSNLELPKEIEKRFLNIPNDLFYIINTFKCIVAPNDSSWFLTLLDYSGTSESAYKWNELEVESLDSAIDDTEWQQEIKDFWDNHFPFFISVKDGYSYLAIRQKDGAVVFGEEPEFEETTKITDSFDSFMNILAEEPEKLSRYINP